jgi:hypothetical protein
MKKGLFLLAVIVLVAAGTMAYAVTATTATVQIYGKWNQMAAPIVPFYPDFRQDGGCWNAWLNESEGLLASDSLRYWDPVGQGPVRFPDDWDNFPNILMGDGYLGYCVGTKGATHHTLTYRGADISDTEAWISLPGKTNGTGGWHYVGIPYPVGKQVSWYDIVITDGLTSSTLGDLLGNGDESWLSLNFYGWNAPSQGLIMIPDSGDYLIGGQMYKVFTKKSNLALILPKPV